MSTSQRVGELFDMIGIDGWDDAGSTIDARAAADFVLDNLLPEILRSINSCCRSSCSYQTRSPPASRVIRWFEGSEKNG